jgi:Ni/Fe-hydrogenase subunit HybB-like protein
MSIEPLWFSTIFGFLFMIVAALVAMAFVIFVLRLLSDNEPLKNVVTASQFNDLGNLMLAFVMLWAYMSFSQFLIIWAGNLKDEIPWYITRAFGGWGALAVFLIVMHFAIPFLLLLQRGVKRRLRLLSIVTGWLVVLTLVDVYWLIVPAFADERNRPQFHVSDFLAVIGIGGIWVGTYIWQLKKMPLLPLHDPRFEGALQHEHGD